MKLCFEITLDGAFKIQCYCKIIRVENNKGAWSIDKDQVFLLTIPAKP